MTSSHKRLREYHNRFDRYVQVEDYQEDLKDIRVMLDRMEKKNPVSQSGTK
jgi:hypothetical protein